MGKITQFIQTEALKPLAMAGALLVVSAASAFTMTSLAQAQETAYAASGPASGAHKRPPHGPREHGGPGGPGFMPFGGPHLNRMLDSVKATDAQRTQIKAIAKQAEADLKPLREASREVHEKTLALFAQPQIDPNAAESLRQQGVANHDAASKRMLKVALDIGNVLTPEQRAQLAAKLKNHHDRMRPGGESHARLEH